MLQVAILRNQPDLVKERLKVKYFKETGIVDEIISLDDERKKLAFQFDDTKSKINTVSKEIGQLMGKGEKDAAESRKKEVEKWKEQLQPIQEKLSSVEKEINGLLVRLPNLPSDKVPEGRTPEENEVVRTGGTSLNW